MEEQAHGVGTHHPVGLEGLDGQGVQLLVSKLKGTPLCDYPLCLTLLESWDFFGWKFFS